MTHSKGYRSRTRHLFAREFRQHGKIPLSTYLHVYRRGEFVDIKGNGSIHKGMPHKIYHGKTGRVWNVTPRAIGVEVNKRVGNRIIKKRIHVRVEHIHKSRCQDDLKKRITENAKIIKQAKGKKRQLKRLPAQPRKGAHIYVNPKKIITVAPLKYELLM